MCILWEEWLGSSENWNQSSYAITLSCKHEQEKVGARRWMTYNQILEKYHNNADVAQSIVDHKESDPALSKTHIKRHPDAPSRDAPCL